MCARIGIANGGVCCAGRGTAGTQNDRLGESFPTVTYWL